MCWLALAPCRCEPAQAEKDPDAHGIRVLLFVRGARARCPQLVLSPFSSARRAWAEPRGDEVVEAPLIVPPSTASELIASESGAGATSVTSPPRLAGAPPRPFPPPPQGAGRPADGPPGRA